MGVRFEVGDDALRVVLTGIDRLLYWRRRVEIAFADVTAAAVVARSSVEELIDSRLLGRGSQAGARRPGGARIGSMMGRGVVGKQFWAAPAGAADQPVLVLDLDGHEFARAVLAVPEPEELAARLPAGPGGR